MKHNKQEERKKQHERHVVERVLILAAGLPFGRLEEGERPDFRLVLPDGYRVGIEVTAWYSPKERTGVVPAEQDGLRDWIANHTTKLLISSDNQRVRASLFFNEQYPVTKKRRKEISETVFDLVQGACSAWDGNFSEIVEIGGSPHELHSIHVSRGAYLKSHCVCVGCAAEATLQPPDIQRLIDRKAALTRAYQTRCDEVLLVIEIHGFKLASMATVDESVTSHEFESPFSRIFILLDGSRSIELKGRPK